MTPSKTLFYLCLSFIVGIAVQSLVLIPKIYIFGFFMFALIVIMIFLFLKNNTAMVIGFCCLVLVLGIMRGQISQFAITQDQLSKLNDKPDKITLSGQIIAEPDIRDTSQKLKVEIDGTKSILLVTVGRYPEYKYLDFIQVTGKLKTPAVLDGFNYKNYLAKDGIYSVMDFPLHQKITKEHNRTIFSFMYEKILWVKGKLVESLTVNFSPPHSPMLEGIIFGNDKNMDSDLKDAFNTTGLSHITAVSGSNIVILISFVMVVFLSLGFWRGQAFYFSLIVMWIYIVMIGFPVSGVRAVIMGSVALLAQKLGRQNTSVRVLVMVAVLMLLQNPMLLRYDISFQLSFLASLGIVYIKPLLDSFFRIMIKEGFKDFLDIVSITFAAQIITLPIIVYNFGRVSLVAPLTNLLVLPIIPILTVLGFLASVAGVFSSMLGFVFSLPCLVLLAYLVKVLAIFSKPWATVSLESISWIWVVVYYLVLALFIWYFNKFQKPKFLGYL